MGKLEDSLEAHRAARRTESACDLALVAIAAQELAVRGMRAGLSKEDVIEAVSGQWTAFRAQIDALVKAKGVGSEPLAR